MSLLYTVEKEKTKQKKNKAGLLYKSEKLTLKKSDRYSTIYNPEFSYSFLFLTLVLLTVICSLYLIAVYSILFLCPSFPLFYNQSYSWFEE